MPAKQSDLDRDVLWKAMKPEGVEGVALVSADDTWSMMRFRLARS